VIKIRQRLHGGRSDGFLRRTNCLCESCLQLHPTLKAVFTGTAWSEQQAIEWIAGTYFDGGTKNVGQLIFEGRYWDIDDQIGELLGLRARPAAD
jgi:hypothetical protein